MYGVWSWVWEQILPAALRNVNVTFLVQSHADTWFWLGIHTFMPGGFGDVMCFCSTKPFWGLLGQVA